MRIAIAVFIFSVIASAAYAYDLPTYGSSPYTRCFATPDGSYICQ